MGDATSLFYSAMVSFLDAMHGLRAGFFSWATVKLYYVGFYAARAILGFNSVGICYSLKADGRGVEFSLKAAAGANPRQERGPTHKTVWRLYQQELPSSRLLSIINTDPAHIWMMGLREQANYKNPKFTEPFVPPHFSFIDRSSLERTLPLYFGDSIDLYTFDPDHACVAFPIACLKQAQISLRSAGKSLDDASWQYLAMLIDNAGYSQLREQMIGPDPTTVAPL